ncbi:MAG: hypothetical protein Ct9H300mP25_09840 [Acidobacteriota bacterium]|nr:MAG: hypothetical protein Ct9H300mP25_09840 [Acidobacteriota bacterium]
MGDDVPFGSRGGLGTRHYFPVDGEYDLAVTLHRNYVNYVRGMGSRHELEVRLDGELVRSFTFWRRGTRCHSGTRQLRRESIW